MDAVSYIKRFEGFVPRLYLCPAGYPTIGYGTRVASWNAATLGPGPAALLAALIHDDRGDWITEEQATALMLPAVKSALSTCIDTFGVALWATLYDSLPSGPKIPGNEPHWRAAFLFDFTRTGGTFPYSPRQIALMDFAYNNGGFSKFPRFVAAVKAGDWQRAHDELLYVNPDAIAKAMAKLIENGAAPGVVIAGRNHRTAYYEQTGKRAETNAYIILHGEMPDA